MSIALLQEKIRARKTPLALVLGPEADKLPARITKNFTDMYGPGDMAQAEALRYHGSQLISQTAPLLPAVVLQAERYLHYGFMGMDVLANLVNMAKAQGLYTIVDARTAAPAVYVEGGIRADGVTVTPYPGSDVCRVGEDKSVFAAVRTGNPSAPEIQNLLSGDRRLYLAAADQMVRHGAALMAETDYVLDVKELRSRAPKAFLLLLGCDGENALPAFDDYGRGALIADTALQYADADAVQAAVRAAQQIDPGGFRGRLAGICQAGGRAPQALPAHSLTLRPAERRVRRQASMAVALSSAVIRNRLGWQNRRPRPLTSRSLSSGFPAQATGNGCLLRLVRWSLTHCAL